MVTPERLSEHFPGFSMIRMWPPKHYRVQNAHTQKIPKTHLKKKKKMGDPSREDGRKMQIVKKKLDI